ncbi:TetR/AcrR family transcriptional regulator [Paeniglutamicibacter psychrophenolicus]|uniref:AcrR family transcriptional regulator n=1 Tax=Paeniglutamicibacter psychrophenolicus TaxID=257454 RepID=A0ABS4WK38_9MICC|nr:TetR/AcrR family transcriptional regulator [Paeniglutamicibacter psychrophenolicus]MBP2376503.1 AcrR family transcriptional regulator [Paeniglutamicibacter psychrophenolicus]
MNLGKVQQAAVSLFAARGFAATGIRDLGAAAGINSATLYHYVGSKEDLLVSIMRDCLNEMIRSGSEALRGSAEPAIQLAFLVSSHVGLTGTNQLTARVAEYEMRALSEANRPAMQELRDEYEALFTQVLERGVRVGAFNTDDLTMARLALMEMGTGVAHWFRQDGRLRLEEVQQYFVNMAYRILAVDSTALDGVDFVVAPRRLDSEPDPVQVRANAS